jgi:peptidoglycan/LPS O-acetylase OafA/YrhL
MNSIIETPQSISPKDLLAHSEKQPYWRELDGVRTFAFLMVFIFHKSVIPGHGNWVNYLNAVTNKFYFGVDLFFVLSGFLITYLLLNERKNTGGISLQRFYLKRSLRIWPMYYLVLLVSAILYSFGYFLNHGSLGYLKNLGLVYVPFLLFLGNFSLIINHCQICDFTDPLGRMCSALTFPLWSLCVEEQFYLVWPVIVKKLRPRLLLKTASGLILAALVFRVVLWLASLKENNFLGYYLNSACNIDALMFGAILAIVQLRYPDWIKQLDRFPIPVTLVSLSIMATVFLTLPGLEVNSLQMVFAMTVMPACMAVILNSAMKLQSLRNFFAAAPLANLGKYTYSAYLSHYLVICALNQIFLQHFLNISNSSRYVYVFSAGLTLTFILARCAWKFIELPMLNLRRKLES